MLSFLPPPAERPWRSQRNGDAPEHPADPPECAEMELPPKLWVHEFADDESSSRYALCAIRFDFVAGEMIATDGRVIIKKSVDLSAFGSRAAVTLQACDLATAIRVMKVLEKTFVTELHMTVKGESYALEIRQPGLGNAPVATLPWRVNPGRWPSESLTQNVFRDPDGGYRDVLLAAPLLRLATRYFDRADPDFATIRLRVPEDSGAPVALQAGGADVRVMPKCDREAVS